MLKLSINAKANLLFISSLLFVVGFIVTFSLISKGPYHADCLNLVIKSQKTLETHQPQFLFGTGYPLTVISAAAFIGLMKLLGIEDPVLAVNFMSVVFSSLTIPFFFLFTEKLLNKLTAFLATILLIVCPAVLGNSVFGNSQSLTNFLLIAGLYWLLRYQQEQLKVDFLLSGFFLGLMGGNRLHDLVLMFIPISFFYLFNTEGTFSRTFDPFHKNKAKKFLIFWSIIFILSAGFHIPYLFQENRDAYLHQAHAFFQAGLFKNFRGIVSFSLLYAFKYIVESLTLFGLFSSIVGLSVLYRTKPKICIFLSLWILCPLFFYGNLLTTLTPRFFVMILPALIIPLCFLINQLTIWYPKTKYVFLILFLILVSFLYKKIYPVLNFRHKHALTADFTRWVGQHTEPNAKIITADERIFFEYYAKRPSLGRPINPNSKALLLFKEQLDKTLDEGIPIYIHATSLYSYSFNLSFVDFMHEHYDLIPVGPEFVFEDWHRGSTNNWFYATTLYKIVKK